MTYIRSKQHLVNLSILRQYVTSQSKFMLMNVITVYFKLFLFMLFNVYVKISHSVTCSFIFIYSYISSWYLGIPLAS